MPKVLWLLLAGLLIVAFVAGCPRDEDGDDTNVTISESETPGTSTVVTDDDGADGEAASTDVDVNVETEGAEGEAAEGETATDAGDAPDADAPADAAADANATQVVIETTEGNITVAVHPEWAPIGAEQFLNLVRANFYNDAPFFRVIPGFVAQVGISPDPALNTEWSAKRIQDDPVVKGNQRGTVVFGTGGPNSRTTHIFFNLVDNSPILDRQGFSAFGEVVEGMDVVDRLHAITDEAGNEVFGMQQMQSKMVAPGGMEQFKQAFPEADYIKRAYIK